MELRLATMEDLEIFNSMYSNFISDTPLEGMEKERFRSYVSKGTIFLAVIKEKVVGYTIVFGYRDKTAEIVQFYITEKRKGHGRLFYKLLENLIRENNFNTVYLHCYWYEAECFWQEMGFRSVKGSEKFSKELY